MEGKTCTVCGKTFPNTSDYFHINGDILRSSCKSCKNKKQRTWNKNNKEYNAKYSKKYRENNKEYLSNYGKQYKSINREVLKWED